MRIKKWYLQNQSGGNEGGGDPAPTPTPTPTPAPEPAPTPEPAPAPKPDDNVTPQIWPDDWRKHIAGDDEKELKRLGRFATPAEVHKAYRSLEQRMSSGELKAALPKDAKPEEVAKWRTENGIPESPEKYDLKFDNGLVIGDDDKPVINEYLKSAHAQNLTQDQVKSNVQWYFDQRAREVEARSAKDETDRLSALDVLNAEYGSSFRQNVNMIDGLLSSFPSAVQESLKSARLPDGTALFNNPDVVRGFVALGLEVNPAGTIVPAGGGDPVKGINERIGEIEKLMGTKAYIKDDKVQQEYRDLITARDKINARRG